MASRFQLANSIREASVGDSIMADIEASIKSSGSASTGKGAATAARYLADTDDKVSTMKRRALGARTDAGINPEEDTFVLDKLSGLARDWMTSQLGDDDSTKDDNKKKLSDLISEEAAKPLDENTSPKERFLRTGEVPRGTELNVPYVESGIRDDAPITYSGDQEAGASGRTAAIDAALREALGEDEKEGPLSPDDMPITRANTDFPSRIGMDNTRGLMSKTEEAITEEAITEEAITEEATPDLIDFAFIMEQEGFEQDIYVPRDEDGVTALDKSGPTIASGFDLGQRNLADLAGLPPALISKLEPYLGLKKQAAIDFVKANALNITEEETAIINSFAKDQETGRLIKLWNKTSKTPWGDLTSEQATVVASVAFQFGNLSTEAPKFWGHVTKGNWDKAIGELRNFGGPTPSRRIREADYLESGTA